MLCSLTHYKPGPDTPFFGAPHVITICHLPPALLWCPRHTLLPVSLPLSLVHSCQHPRCLQYPRLSIHVLTPQLLPLYSNDPVLSFSSATPPEVKAQAELSTNGCQVCWDVSTLNLGLGAVADWSSLSKGAHSRPFQYAEQNVVIF